MIDAERYCLGLMAGEMGEALDEIGKALRFGLASPDRNTTAASFLAIELGDVLAAIDFAVIHGLVDSAVIQHCRVEKRRKLLDPNALDNLGRRLAPAPPRAGTVDLPASSATAILGDRLRR